MTTAHIVLARIVEHVEPIERGERYEDPLAAFLAERGLGSVAGGGSQLTATGEIEFADVELELTNLDEAVSAVVAKLEGMGAPFGSAIEFAAETGRAPLRFGKYEQVVVYLDGVGLPRSVYDNLDFDQLYRALGEAAHRDAGGEARSVWAGRTETAVHLAGPSADALEKVVRSLWDTVPVIQNARLVLRYSDGREPAEVRLPMR